MPSSDPAPARRADDPEPTGEGSTSPSPPADTPTHRRAGDPDRADHRPTQPSTAAPDEPGAPSPDATTHRRADRADAAGPGPSGRARRDPSAAVAMRPSATVRAVTAPRRAELAAGSSLLAVTRWADPLLDQFGHDPRSPYVERFWLGVLGPSATWLLRALAHRFDDEPDGFTLDLPETAKALGIGARGGANGPFFRTLERVIAFGFARCTGPASLEVRARLAPLNRRQLQRLPRSRRFEHEAWVAAHPPAASPSQDDLRRRARALALSLLELGEDLDATEQQLHRWRFHPAVAYDSVRWAATVHEHRRAQVADRSWTTPAPDGLDPHDLGARGDLTPHDPAPPGDFTPHDLAPPGGDAA